MLDGPTDRHGDFRRVELLATTNQIKNTVTLNISSSAESIFTEVTYNYSLTPALRLTDFKGPTISIYHRRISVIANIKNKEYLFKGHKNIFCYWRISVIGGSVIAGFKCISKNFDSKLKKYLLRSS